MLISSPVLSHLFLLDPDWSRGSAAYPKNTCFLSWFNSAGVNRAKPKPKQKAKQKAPKQTKIQNPTNTTTANQK